MLLFYMNLLHKFVLFITELKNRDDMKKAVLAFLIVLMTWSFGKINAQEYKPFRFGLHASPSIAWVKPDVQEYESAGAKLGFSYGLLAEFNFSENYAFSTGLDISYFGGKLEYMDYPDVYFETEDTIAGDISSRYSLQYVQIPLMLKMSTNEIGYITYFANVGLGTAIRIGASVKDQYGNNSRETDDISSDVAFFRESFIIGLGAEYSLGGNTSVIGTLNFNNGFTTTIKRENKLYNIQGNAIANYIELKVGVMF